MQDKYEYQKLEDFCKEVFMKMGCNSEDAELASDVLVNADLRGVDSHGVPFKWFDLNGTG